MSDPIQSLFAIAERCWEMQRSCNPSKLPTLCADVADLADIVRQVVMHLPTTSFDNLNQAAIEHLKEEFAKAHQGPGKS